MRGSPTSATRTAGAPGTTSSRVRLDPAQRREQLLDLGIRLLATRPLEELTIEALAEQAGISRGLLYHYFGNKQEFHRAVVRRAADDLIAITAPRDLPEPIQQLTASLAAYLDYVEENYQGYVSLVRSASGGDASLREIYESARQALTDRLFDAAGPQGLEQLGMVDSPATRLLAHAWSAMVEDAVIAWAADRRGGDVVGMSRETLLEVLVTALPAVVGQDVGQVEQGVGQTRS